MVISRTAAVTTETIPLKSLNAQSQYSLLYSLNSLAALTSETRIKVVRQGAAVLAAKTLHAGDADFYTQFRVPRGGSALVAIAVTDAPAGVAYQLQVNRWPRNGQVKSAPVHRWQDASLIPLGKTVFGSGDDTEYIALPGTARKTKAQDPDGVGSDIASHSREPRPKLVFFQIELTERDQVPVDVAVFRVVDGKLKEYYEGEDPVTLPHEVQALPGNKFTPRVLKRTGQLLHQVRANHPEYKLRTRVYDVPPYDDPKQAVRTGLDYILAAGDSWHANTPRRGGILDRVDSVHQETSLCVGCHRLISPSVRSFTQRAMDIR